VIRGNHSHCGNSSCSSCCYPNDASTGALVPSRQCLNNLQ